MKHKVQVTSVDLAEGKLFIVGIAISMSQHNFNKLMTKMSNEGEFEIELED